MNSPSLQRQLIQRLLALVLLTALVSGLLSAWLAFHEARHTQDDLLQQLLQVAERGKLQVDVEDSGAEDALVILPLASAAQWFVVPDGVDTGQGDGLHDGLQELVSRSQPDERWRVLVRSDSGLLVGQRLEVRNELIMDAFWQSFLPLLLLLPLLWWLVGWLIHRSFQPLLQLSAELPQHLSDGEPVPESQRVPAEILPFTQAVNQLFGRQQWLLRQQQRFVADAAHELRTPVSSLQLMLDNLRSLHSADELLQRLPAIQMAVQRLRQLVNQLLDLARINDGSDLVLTDVNLQEWLAAVVEIMLPVADERGIDLGVGQFDDGIVHTDAGRLQRVLVNAIDNALRYSPAGTQVTVSVLCNADWLELRVEDQGPGIAPDMLEQVFEPFVRDNRFQNIPGTGLGLAIVRDIARQLQGEVWLQPRAEGGLCFGYRQPVIEARPD
ncbi:sensor histidine kinase [Parathalassolituus penaei]|uniref:histidine kinase n=1 Tax=Parathalassolituus penaei TaxID=2997323 RepID=A0A9X3EEH6_9GAMM|nr:HAMP domain-containing sensor histidine kinase [Parathalassolituus penaei]MCY0966074.1 HAMP domain-containing sensor histidine kinase [Parathalassolituus penaei]